MTLKRTRFGFIFLLGFLMVAPAGAALSPLSGEFAVLGKLTGHQDNPHLAFGRSGGFVTWQTATAEDIYQRVHVQRLGPDMIGVGAAIRVSRSERAFNEMNPRVAMLKNGGAAVVWEGGSRAASNIHIRFMNNSGAFISPELIVNTYQTGVQDDPDVVVLAGGNVVVAWSSLGQDGSDEGIYGQLFNAAGARVGGEFQLNQTTNGNQSDPSVVALRNGGFAAAWMGEMINGRTSSGASNLRGNIVGCLFNGYGRAMGNEFRLNEGDAIGGSPSMGGSADGGFVLAWTMRDEENARNLSDVYVRTFNDQGSPLGAQSRHNTFLKGQQISPQVVRLGEDAMVVWTSYGQDGSGGSVQGRMVSGGREFGINTQKNMHQKAPAVATDGGNKFLVVWVNTLTARQSILSGQRYVTTDGELDGVVDLTEGEVEIVEATTLQRATPSPVSRQQAAPKPAVQAEEIDPVVNLAIVTPKPRAAVTTVVDATKSTTNTGSRVPSQRPATTSIPRSSQVNRSSLATLRGLRPSSTATRSRTAGVGQSALIAAAQRNMQRRNLLALGSPSLASRQASNPARSSVTRLAQRQSAPSSSGSSRNFSSYQRTSTARNNWNYGNRSSLASRQIGLRTAMTQPSQSAGDRLSRMRSGTRKSTQQNRPVAAALMRSDSGTRLQWHGRRGARYQVQGSDDLNTWQGVGAARSGIGGADSVNLNSENGPRYYRVVRMN